MLKERDGLWYKVLVHKYNNEVPPSASNWWKDIHSMCFDAGGEDWMNSGLCRKVGEGNEVDFWNENWLGSRVEGKVRAAFYPISSAKECA